MLILRMVKLEELRDKKVVLLGYGREGKDTFRFLRRLFPRKKIGIADQKFDKDYLKKLKDYDVIIKSPGVPFKILPRNVLDKITTQTEIFFDNCPGKIVGITGTKGKSTTTSLIYQILKSGGVKAHLVGNIGKPVLNLLFSARPNDVYIYELSSFQLTNLKKSPHVAVLLNIYSEHLDYYRNFREYAKAKANITLHQTKNDYLVFNLRNKFVREIAEKSQAQKIPIRGEYYELDRNAARAVGRIFQVPAKIIEKAIKNFQPLPHRLELVGKFRGLIFYNDSIATIPEATIGALNKLGDRVETLFLGGHDRGVSFSNLAKRIRRSRIKNVMLFPPSGKRIAKELKKMNKRIKYFFVKDMLEAIKLARQYTGKNKIVLLSPSSPSFGLFRDYAERGNLFKKYVKKFGAR